MSVQNKPECEDISVWLQAQESKSFLRFLTCGSVDDGKSTLIGRLLYDSHQIYEDQLASIVADSGKKGEAAAPPDLALLVDGLAAEREQGITIDVAYRFFSTARRKFIVADTPGHEQYTRNMATGASTADLAVLLVDAREGLLTQTRRHSYIISLLGIRHVVVAINKMDLVSFSQQSYDDIVQAYANFSKDLGFEDVCCIPVCALAGDNVTIKSKNMSWYQGSTLLEHLETVEVGKAPAALPFRLPVQWVNRPDSNFRGYTGTIVQGAVKPGDEVVTIPSGRCSRVREIVTMSGALPQAVTGQAITLTLEDEVDIARGDVICGKNQAALKSDQFAAHIIWMSDKTLLPGRQYLLKMHHKSVAATITDLKYKVNVNSFSHEADKTLMLNEIGVCNLSLSAPVAFDPYKVNRQMGSFILIDRHSNETVGAGMLDFSLRRADNLTWQALEIDKAARAMQKHQRPAVLWFTGLSGAGKSTIANLVEQQLFDLGRHTYILDGDNVRHGLNKDLGFKDADRVENIRRVAETAKLMADAGLITLVSFISPFRAERRVARDLIEAGEFIEIYVNTPLAVAEQRDVKGLYKKARAGEIKNFTGIDSDYQPPENPEIEVDTVSMTAAEAAERIVRYLQDKGLLALG